VVRHRAGQLGLSRCEISHGLAARGGGIHAAAPLTLSQCDVWLNLADGSGGGLYVDLLPGDALRISDTEVTFNRALQPVAHGGGVYVDGGSATIQRSLLAFNEAEDGGGVYALGSSVGIENSTL